MNKRTFSLAGKTSLPRGALFGYILLGALLAFEIFNFGTTDFALRDLLGDLKFAGLRWATILSVAFCGIDFAGIARLFTPEQGREEPMEVWYLFGAWLLAAAMNASLTWWGVSVAILTHQPSGSALLAPSTLTKAIPVFVAVMVWLIRVLIIGTFSVAGERLFSMAETRPQPRPAARSTARTVRRPAPKPRPASVTRSVPSAEPTYHPVGLSGMNASSRNESSETWR